MSANVFLGQRDFVDWIKDWKEHGCPRFPIFHRPHSSLTKKDINTSVTEALAASSNAVERKIQQLQSQLELAHQKSANDLNTIHTSVTEALAASSNAVERKIQQLQSQLELAHQKSANDSNTIQNLQEQLKATKIDYSTTIKVLEEQQKASQIDYSTTIKVLEEQRKASQIDHSTMIKVLEEQRKASQIDHSTMIKVLKDTNHQFLEHFSDFQQKLHISHAAEIAHLKELAQV
jgi:hypothetical protein